MTKRKKLYRDKKDRVILGLIGGMGEYFDTDPVVLRLLWLLITIFSGIVPGLLVYLVGSLLVPEK